MADKKWSPDKDEATKRVIRDTIGASGSSDPSAIPHRQSDRVRRQAKGDLDVDGYVKETKKDRKR